MSQSVVITAGGTGRYGESRGYFQGTINGPVTLGQLTGGGKGIPVGTNTVLVTVEGGCRWVGDGTGATATKGTPLAAGVTLQYTLDPNKFSICPTGGASVVVNIEFAIYGL